ncbi:helix-turn-helix domain-containing protein [Candidatus Woesearchaeota archaeon]|nr:helix-turn-helix domain-containing protein [Candidatus Woesearchaeota archaeon]
MNQKLLEETGILLFQKGFTVKQLERSCFDILARKGSRILLMKVLMDANAITKEHANEMKKVSSYLQASPVVIAEKAGTPLEENVVYLRLGIPTLTIPTFKSAIEDKLPFLLRTNAGLTANIIGEKLREKREQQGLSLQGLSKKIGVSRRMIVKYEQENAEMTLQKAVKMYDLFGHEIFSKINIFSQQRGFVEEQPTPFTQKYHQLGFAANQTKKLPFDIIAKRQEEIILTDIGDKVKEGFASVSRLLDADNLVIFERKKPKDVPAITKEEFLEFGQANELIKFLKEF